MEMEGLARIVGKKIAGVQVASRESAPGQRVFLVFSDGSSFELSGEALECGTGLEGLPHSLPVSIDESPELDVEHLGESVHAKLERDLMAWLDTKSLIARVKREASRR